MLHAFRTSGRCESRTRTRGHENPAQRVVQALKPLNRTASPATSGAGLPVRERKETRAKHRKGKVALGLGASGVPSQPFMGRLDFLAS